MRNFTKKAKKKYYTDLKMSEINNHKTFRKKLKPICGNKVKGSKTITLVEGNEGITDDGKLAETFIEYFMNIALSMGITSFLENNDDLNNDNFDNTITELEGVPSIVAIKKQNKSGNPIKLSTSNVSAQTKPLEL